MTLLDIPANLATNQSIPTTSTTTSSTATNEEDQSFFDIYKNHMLIWNTLIYAAVAFGISWIAPLKFMLIMIITAVLALLIVLYWPGLFEKGEIMSLRYVDKYTPDTVASAAGGIANVNRAVWAGYIIVAAIIIPSVFGVVTCKLGCKMGNVIDDVKDEVEYYEE